MPNAHPSRHHYVPRAFLRHFATDARDVARLSTPTIVQVNNLRDLMTTEFVLKPEPQKNIKSEDPYDQALFWP